MTLYNNFWLKRGVGLFSRVGLFSGYYGIIEMIIYVVDVMMASVLYWVAPSVSSVPTAILLFYSCLHLPV